MRERYKVKIFPPNKNCIVNSRALGKGLSVMGGEGEYLVGGHGFLRDCRHLILASKLVRQ